MKVEKGKQVTLEYEGKLENGELFDSSKHGDHSHPLVFVAGMGMVVPGFDNAVMGMSEGEKKEFTIEPEEAYGPYREELKQEIPRDKLPKEPEPKEGMMLVMGTPDGGQFPVKIAEVKEDKVVMDMNHPLAGKKLTFNIEITKVEDAPKAEDVQEPAEEKKEESLEDLAGDKKE